MIIVFINQFTIMNITKKVGLIIVCFETIYKILLFVRNRFHSDVRELFYGRGEICIRVLFARQCFANVQQIGYFQ